MGGDTRATRLLFVNPGGPGVTADWLAPAVASLEPGVHATHDILAVDPPRHRGQHAGVLPDDAGRRA